MNDEEIKIEKGIPIPPATRRWNGRAKWADLLQRMEVGDSAVVPYPKVSCIYAACRALGFKIRIKALEWGAGRNRMVRMWRLK